MILLYFYLVPLIIVLLAVGWCFYIYDKLEAFYLLRPNTVKGELQQMLIIGVLLGCVPLVNIYISYLLIDELLKDDSNLY